MSLRDHPFRIYYGPADDPLANFYIPALSASVRYDRSAGFFSSSALAVAAAGVARLIQNCGRMRLLVGASLDEGDVEAIRKGHDLQERVTTRLLERFPDPQDALLRERLEVLAWMVAEGTLEIRVVLPRDAYGLPIPASQSQDYYHPKTGIFTDTNGDRVAFTGSVNESATAWCKNYESFLVLFSWDATKAHLEQITVNFERLWQGQEPDWIALDIPAAVRDRLLVYRPQRAPERDPLEHQTPPPVAKELGPRYFGGNPQAERILFQFLRDAPYLPGAIGLGAATAAITPWPHQTRVANELLADFPGRALLCDEVGLGKTIEAGLVIRQLFISGRVKRCLILAPKSVLNQWQEELYEKFALEIPRYEDGKLLDVHDQPLPLPNGGANLWDTCDVLLASSQLAKRSDRRNEVLAARPWDLLVVDEAHHARRKDFLQPAYRPNRLLSLLNDLKERDKYAGLLLLTATPMQINPLEVWDLLTVLGMGGRWGADEGAFLRFFGEMRKPFGQADWDFIFDMVDDYLAAGGELEPVFREQVASDLGPVKWATLEELPRRHGERGALLKQLGPKTRPHVIEMARRHTPLSRAIYRNTRDLLRKYREKGILKESVPTRRPEIKRVPMRPDEQTLYERIEEYITQFYQKYENERRGLGFVMTVYRRRLTSSFWAIQCSLERRLKFLNGAAGVDTLLTDEDTEQEELDLDILEEAGDLADGASRPEPGEGPPSQVKRFAAELAYVQDFIQELRQLSSTDSKLEVLKAELNQVFKQRTTVLIFTQYTDTMDYLRDQLHQVYGSQVACYSGRGGEVWNGIAWVQTSKEAVKADFRSGKIRVLIGTESASEGLNLQTCGVLINYDMPWNPMRVEQRIGRIDRIGQVYPVVWISNYFYQDTIEDQICQRLADRIEWFEVVVGDLQPILAQVGEITKRLAMLPASEREVQLEKEIADLRERLQHREVESLDLDAYLRVEDYQPGPPPPVTLAQLEDLLTHAQATGHLFQRHPDLANAYLLHWQGEQLPVTFSPACFDEYPTTVRFLSYGSPLLAEILSGQPAAAEESLPSAGLARCTALGDFELRGWYVRPQPAAPPALIASFASLVDHLKANAQTEAPDDSLVAESQACFALELAQAAERHADIVRRQRTAHYLTIRSRAQFLLLRAALVEIALGQTPALFDGDVYPSEFDEQAVSGLRRHGFPWAPLLKLAHQPGLAPDPSNDFYLKIAGEKRESLVGRLNQLKGEARELVKTLSAASAAANRDS